MTGALVHDIGKIEAYGQDADAHRPHRRRQAAGRDTARLLTWSAAQIEQIDGFPWELARALLHIQLSHHGTHENGSPVVPATREATIVHTIDNLGGKLGSFDRLEKGLADGASWSSVRPRARRGGLLRGRSDRRGAAAGRRRRVSSL